MQNLDKDKAEKSETEDWKGYCFSDFLSNMILFIYC